MAKVNLDLSYEGIRALQVAVQHMNADMPGHPGLDEATKQVADIPYPTVVAPPVAPPAS